MAWVTRIGSNPAQVEYRLTGGHGCEPGVTAEQMEYRTNELERPLRWIGGGLAAFGIEAGAVFAEGDVERARLLMAGCDPQTGEQLVAPKVGVPEDAKVACGPLVRAVRAICDEADVSPEQALGSLPAARAFERMERAVRAKGEAARVRADEAGQVADAALLDVDRLWGSGVFGEALGNLSTTSVTTAEDGSTTVVESPRRVVVGNAGYDVTFTLPKSMSLLLAFSSEQDAAAVEATYAANVGRVFDWLEATTAYGMRGHHGGGKSADVVDGDGFNGWVMTHRAARPVEGAQVGDPHWHVHVNIANMTRGSDGKFSTVAAGGRDLMRHVPAADQVFQALVRGDLSARFGFRFDRSERSGQWEVSHVPDATIRAFSRRGEGIEAMLAELGLDAASATRAQAQMAKAKGRQAKDGTPLSDVELRNRWREHATAVGIDPDQVLAQVRRDGSRDPERDAARLGLVLARVLDPEHGLTGHRRRFTTADALAAVADALPDGAADVAEIERLTRAALKAAGVVPLGGVVVHGRDSGRQLAAAHMRNADRYTTADVVAAEQVILNRAAASPAARPRAVVDERTAAAAIDIVEAGQGFRLSGEQRAIATALATSGRDVEYLIGPPGTGKTTLLRAARAAWEAGGYRVAGAATAAVAAQNLAAESGIASRTVRQWRWSITHPALGGGLRDVDVLVLDESNLTDDRDRAALYAAAADAGVKIVEVGDPRQLRGVGCGSVFGFAADTYGAHQLTENRRQVDEDERVAIGAVRAGEYATALTMWADKGALVVTDTGEAAATAMAAEWMRARAGAPDPLTELSGLVMLSATNEGVARLNAAAHAIRAATGELGHSHTYATRLGDQVEFSVGDHVMLRSNDRHERRHDGDDVLNGQLAHVTAIDEHGAMTIRWDGEGPDGPEHRGATLPAQYVASGGVVHGYAMTIHKAEGLTIGAQWERPDGTRNRGTVLVDPAGADTAGVYVALSRHKGDVKMFAGLEQLEDPDTTWRLGPAKDPHSRAERGIAALAARMAALDNVDDDTPVAAERGHVPADEQTNPREPEDRMTALRARLARAGSATEQSRSALDRLGHGSSSHDSPEHRPEIQRSHDGIDR